MQKVDLGKLLERRKVIYPTCFEQMCIDGSDVTIRYQGYPWWSVSGKEQNSFDSTLTLRFVGVHDGTVKLSDFEQTEWEKDLEVLTVEEAYISESAEIFCHDSIDCPDLFYKLYIEYQDQNDFVPAFSDLFNCGNEGGCTGFERVVKNSAFLLFRGPLDFANVVETELESRGIDFKRHKHSEHPKLLKVRLNDSVIYCTAAQAEFEGADSD